MAVNIGAQGFVGIAPEVTSGTYVAPTKFFPIMSESVQWTQDNRNRRVIRQTADILGVVPGNGHVEGDIEMEVLPDVLPYFWQASRTVITKTGASAPFTYEAVPAHGATPAKTLSITVVRNGVAFGYVGCVLAGQSFGVDNATPTVTLSIMGTAEANQSVPTPAYTNDDPFGAGMWSIQVPTASQVFDADNFSLEIDEGAEAQMRLKSSLGAQFISFGERDVTLSIDRDFENRTEYDQFKAVTSKSITVAMTHAGGHSMTALIPVAYIDGYPVSLDGVGDLIRASVSYVGAHDAATGGAYKLTVITDEDVTV